MGWRAGRVNVPCAMYIFSYVHKRGPQKLVCGLCSILRWVQKSVENIEFLGEGNHQPLGPVAAEWTDLSGRTDHCTGLVGWYNPAHRWPVTTNQPPMEPLDWSWVEPRWALDQAGLEKAGLVQPVIKHKRELILEGRKRNNMPGVLRFMSGG